MTQKAKKRKRLIENVISASIEWANFKDDFGGKSEAALLKAVCALEEHIEQHGWVKCEVEEFIFDKSRFDFRIFV